MAIQKIRSQRVQYDIATFVGNAGQIFYNEDVGDLRLSDGITQGGIPLLLGGGNASIVISETPPENPTAGALTPSAGSYLVFVARSYPVQSDFGVTALNNIGVVAGASP